jgi:hypothetical protein
VIDRTGEVWSGIFGGRSTILIVRSYVPAGYPERFMRHDAVQLEDGWRFGVEELVLQHREWKRML